MSPSTSSPFFSVVLPVRNGEKYLPQAFQSVLGQTDTDWEVVAVDDASSDRTPEILGRFAAENPGIRILKNEQNLGIAKSLNRGIQEARGEWIVRLDSDDCFATDYLETLRSYVAELRQPQCFISSWVTVIDGSGEKVLDMRLPSAEKISRMMAWENFLCHPATSFHKKVWERVGGYPEVRRAEDTEMWKRFLRGGIPLIMIPQPLVYYRIHDSNFTSFQDYRRSQSVERQTKLLEQYHEWRISLFLKQCERESARQEILLLKDIQQGFSLKNFCYYLLTFLPRAIISGFMWEIRPRLRHFARVLARRVSSATLVSCPVSHLRPE